MSNYKPGDLNEIQELLGSPVDIASAAAETNIQKINALAFELYKEASIFVGVTGNLAESTATGKVGLERNQAICVGLLIRMAKFMLVVTQLSATRNRGEVVHALNRCIMEPAINLEFLVRVNEDKYYDQFVAYSFGPERELFDQINSNIKARGSKLPIEERMLRSILDKCKTSGVDIDEVPAKHREWAMNMRERLKRIGREERYTVYRLLSHSIHGTWMDLLMYNLEEDKSSGLYEPNAGFMDVDARVLIPQARIALEAVTPYIKHFFALGPETVYLVNRIGDLIARMIKVDAIHEELMHA